MTLFGKQKAFSMLLANFLIELERLGYEVTIGEAWRPPETAALYAKDGRGISNSLHSLRIAVDLNLFKDGKFLQKTEEYGEAGEVWESMSYGDITCCWGGQFGDGGHFSIEHQGVR